MGSRRPVVFLHIGAMKSGTTFLQHLMDANRENLSAAGFFVAGSRLDQSRATRDALGRPDKAPAWFGECAGTWEALVGRVFAHGGHASLFSMEFLSFADAQQAARIVESLDRAEVHIVLTVRDASRALPGQWQTHTQSGGTGTLPRFARTVRKGVRDGAPYKGDARVFMRAQAIPRILEAWSSAVPSDRLHVITVPRPGSSPTLLWERFAGVVGVDPEVASISSPKSNRALGHASTELVRRINRRLGKLSANLHSPTVRAELAAGILAERAALEEGVRLNLSASRFAVRWNRRVRRAIRRSGAHLVGDLRDLPVRLPADAEQTIPKSFRKPTGEELLGAACTARDGLLQLIQTRAKPLEERGREVDLGQVDFGDLPTASQRWGDASDPVDAAVDELSSLVRVAIDLRSRRSVAATARPDPRQ